MEAIGRLVAGVAHDFNNLLTGIMLYCDLLLGELQKDERLRHYVEEIHGASKDGGALIAQMLAVVRRKPAELQLMSLNDVVRTTQDLLSRLAGEHIKLAADLESDLGMVKMNPAHAQQISLNLVLNARDAMPEGGTIVIATRNRGLVESRSRIATRSVELRVSDSGSGMSAGTCSQIFEDGFTTKPSGRGTGLGLNTVQNLVTTYGGSIQVESRPGKGTRVTVRLACNHEVSSQRQSVSIATKSIDTWSDPSPLFTRFQRRRGNSA